MDRRAGRIWGEFPRVSLTELQVTSGEFSLSKTVVFMLILLSLYPDYAVCAKGLRGP